MKRKESITLFFRYGLFCIFVMIILFGFGSFAMRLDSYDELKDVEEYFANIDYKSEFIDVYGLSQRILGKRQIENFTIAKTDYNKLVQIRADLSEEDVEAKYDELDDVLRYLNESGIPYYYIDCILPIQDSADIPFGMQEYSHTNLELTNQILQKNGVNIIDIRNNDSIKSIAKERLFYYTDHHWRLETAYEAYCKILNQLSEDLHIDCNERCTTNLSNYSLVRYDNSFLGSYGVKVGKYYDGKDDLIIYIPNFSTDFSFAGYDPEGTLVVDKQGDFSEALLDQEVLNNVEYIDKYNAFLNAGHGGCEYRIINNNPPNGKKCLFISHSYGRPISMYLAMNFAETINIDPQIGRFNGNFLTYIEEYKPDVVLFLVEFEGEIIGNFRTFD